MVENAPRTLGLVSRVLKMASTRTRQLAYKTLVRPILFRVWMPSVHCATRPGSQHQAALTLTRCVKGRGGFLTLPRYYFGTRSLQVEVSIQKTQQFRVESLLKAFCQFGLTETRSANSMIDSSSLIRQRHLDTQQDVIK